MDVSTISDLIATLGFPICTCGVLFYYVKYRDDKNDEKMQELEERHREDYKAFSDTITNNTLALTNLLDFLKGGGDEDEQS